MKQCDCVEKANVSSIRDRNTKIVTTGTGRAMVYVERASWGPGTSKPVGVVADFCPFCGVEYRAPKWPGPPTPAAEPEPPLDDLHDVGTCRCHCIHGVSTELVGMCRACANST